MKSFFKLILVICFVFLHVYNAKNVFALEPPYPPSQVIESITWSNKITLASGSDLWPATWASDGNLYTMWGDGEDLEVVIQVPV